MNSSKGWLAHDEVELEEHAPEPAPGRRTRTMALPARLQRSPDGTTPPVAAIPAAAMTAAPGRAATTDAMIIDDGAAVQPGQIARTTFLAQLHPQVIAAASEALGPIWSVVGCPYIESWFRSHAQTSAAELDKLAKRYSGIAAPKSAGEYIGPILARLRSGIARWKSGENVGGDAAAAGLGISALPLATPPTPAPANPEGGGGGAIQLKSDGTGGGTEPDSPAAVLQELGGGRALDGTQGHRLGAAMGDNFSDVRIHTDGVAARKASELGARAFTVGTHVAFAAGQYRPGTPEGDALLAHELAHVQQQRGGAIDATARKKAEVEGPEGAFELEADLVAAAAITQLHQEGTQATARAKSSLKSTLALKRCSNGAPTPTVTSAAPSATGPDPDLMKGTHVPTETQQNDVNTILHPTSTGSGAASKKFIAAGFQSDMTKAMTAWMDASFKDSDHLDKGGPDVIKLDMPQVRQTGKAAQQTVVKKYGPYIQGAMKDPGTATSDSAFDISDPKVLHPQEDTIDKVSKAKQDAVVTGLIEYGMRQPDGGKPVATKHNLDPDRPEDLKARNEFITAFAKNKANYAKLIQIQRMWPGEEHPGDHTIYIQQRREVDADLAKKEKADPTLLDAQMRRGYWSTFLVLIHEFIHAAAHANYIAAEGSGAQDQILSEGAADYLLTFLWADVLKTLPGDNALREMVEGKKYPYSPNVVATPDRYDEWKDVQAFIAKLGPSGEQNFLAAYFLGHVELIGLGKWKKGMEVDVDTYYVTVDDFSVATVAEQTFVDEATIRSENGLGPTDKLKKGPAKVPGVSWHVCIDKETMADIARQRGVTEAALDKANPGAAKYLFNGKKILIPKH